MADQYDNNENLGTLDGFKLEPDSAGKKKKRKAKRLEDAGPLAITSLMDILTVLLIFLIKSYSTSAVSIQMDENEMVLPASTAQIEPEEATKITITRSQVFVEDKLVATIDRSRRRIDPVHKDGGDDSYLIRSLRDEMSSIAERERRIASRNAAVSFTGTALVIADRETPYRIISEVIYSAGQAEYNNFRMTVIKEE